LSGGRGVYLAFNKSIAAAAQRSLPSNVTARTVHSFAGAGVGMPFPTGEHKNISSHLVAKACGEIWLPDFPVLTQKRWMADALRHFPQSADAVPGRASVDAVLDVIGILSEIPPDKAEHRQLIAKRREAADRLLSGHLASVWSGIVADRRLWSFEVILKVFALSPDAVRAAFSGQRFLMVDECQDLNGVMRSICSQAAAGRVLVAVGDPWQQIYSWNGAENALDHMQGKELYLTQSFRFGWRLADMASRLLASKPEARPPHPIRGNPARETWVSMDTVSAHHFPASRGDTVICRTNAGVLSAAVMAALRGMTIHVVKGLDDLIAECESGVALREARNRDVRHPTFLQYADWTEAKIGAEEDANLRRLVDGIESGQLAEDLETVKRAVRPEATADLRISTAHKTKGLEFKSVILWSDFATPEKLAARYEKALAAKSGRDAAVKAALEEWHVRYVAATRAIDSLTIIEPPRR